VKKWTFNNLSFESHLQQLRKGFLHQKNLHTLLKNYRLEQEAYLKEAYFHQINIHILLLARTELVDALLCFAWEIIHIDPIHACLISAGGYGRKELLPYSDIDVFILYTETLKNTSTIEEFVALLWDLGLKVSHTVCTVTECVALAKEDITVMTSLLECRFLLGHQPLFDMLQEAIAPHKIWDSAAFLLAKEQEQENRHKKYGHSSYHLEPHVKEGPGGLRDIQTMVWIGKRHFSPHSDALWLKMDFLTPRELKLLEQDKNFLWNVRCALHYFSGRKEDRLLFEYQIKLATQLGYEDEASSTLPLQQFMKDYYQTIKRLSALNHLLLQFFKETILYKDIHTSIPLNERFQLRNRYIEISHPLVFKENPSALLELFYLMACDEEIKGIGAHTLRALQKYHSLINSKFINNPKNTYWFLSLLNEKQDLSKQLTLMNLYGLLDRLIPDFSSTIGQMQYDLFHVYTVDQHLISVVHHLYLCSVDASQFPLAFKLLKELSHYRTLYMAALFHDIGKGKGGDHSHLGEKIVEKFCKIYNIDSEEARLIQWLVKNHLLMSSTAQQKDIYDPDIIQEFSKAVETKEKLDALYLLTIADIRGTNPSLWNGWKDTLLKNLYEMTLSTLSTVSLKEPSIQDIKQKALQLLNLPLEMEKKVMMLWDTWGHFYFRRTPLENIARHTMGIMNEKHHGKPIVLITNDVRMGATEVFIYLPAQDYHFATTTVTLSHFNLNIVEAQITTTKENYKLDVYYVITPEGTPLTEEPTIQLLKKNLVYSLSQKLAPPKLTKGKLSRQQKHFHYPTSLSFKLDVLRQRTEMTLTTLDRPGLLARLCLALVDCHLLLQGAKIATLGERVEDVFFITTLSHTPLTQKDEKALEQSILYYLDEHS